MAPPTFRRVPVLAALLLAACTPGPATPTQPGAGPAPASAGERAAERARGSLPPVSARSGPLAIDVVYPGEGQALTTADSNFIFGSVGTSGARLTINGQPVEVAPNGAFLGFLRVPANGAYDVVAEAGGQRATARRTVTVPAAASPGCAALSIAGGTLAPAGAITVQEGERVTVRFRATQGATARLVFPDGTSIPLVPRSVVQRAEGFQQDVSGQPREFTEYAGTFAARTPLGTIRGTVPVTVAPLPPGTG